MPHNWPAITRPSNNAAAKPMAMPEPTSFKPLRTTHREHARAVRSQGHADADFLGLPRGHVPVANPF
jgi:hypothetical protein